MKAVSSASDVFECLRNTFGVSKHALMRFGAYVTPEGEVDHSPEHLQRNTHALVEAVQHCPPPGYRLIETRPAPPDVPAAAAMNNPHFR